MNILHASIDVYVSLFVCVCHCVFYAQGQVQLQLSSNYFQNYPFICKPATFSSRKRFLLVVKISLQRKQHVGTENDWKKGLHQSHKGEGELGSDRCPDQDLNLPCQKSWHWAPDPGCHVNTWPAADKRREINKSMGFQPHRGRGRGRGVAG